MVHDFKNNFSIFILIVLFIYSCDNKRRNSFEYYPNGNVKSKFEYLDSLRDGNSYEYFLNGKLQTSKQWINDTLNGHTLIYYPSGGIKEVIHFHNGVLDGYFENYFENGNVRMKGYYRKGILHGKVLQYFEKESGRVQAEINYINYHGQQKDYGSIWYDSVGNVIKEFRRVELTSKIDTFNLGETLELEIELKKPRFDTTLFVLGDYDDKFFVGDSLKFDTLIAINHKYKLKLMANKVGNNFIRGHTVNYRTISKTKENTIEESILPLYFEYKYFVK
jgi:antitoxin component YwqK of YwqJK toxin-antitoxin module